MSSLLERMVQRVRGPLPGIEPLLQSRYSRPRTANQRPSDTENADSFTEVSELVPAESGSVSHLSEALRSSDNSNPSVIGSSETTIPRRAHRPAPESGSQHSTSTNAAAEAPPDRQIARDGLDSARQAAEPSARKYAAEERPRPLQSSTRASAQPDTELAGTAGSPQRFVPKNPFSGLQPMVRKATDLTAPEKMAQEQAGLTPQSNTGPMTLSPFERDSGLPQLPAMTPIPAKAGPEITISIGHIEVRAGPVAEHPRKPAFRPRVSLDDFLKQGDRRHP